VIRLPLISGLALLTIAACSGHGPVDKAAANTNGLPDIKANAPSASGEPHRVTAAKPDPSGTPAARIPAALHGRWGLTPADCTAQNVAAGNSKGLLEVGADSLKFYESRAIPASEINVSNKSISGNFAFTGEGQSWTKYESLRAGQDILVRTEINPSASFSYAKCS
jgi:hypothetical protein